MVTSRKEASAQINGFNPSTSNLLQRYFAGSAASQPDSKHSHTPSAATASTGSPSMNPAKL